MARMKSHSEECMRKPKVNSYAVFFTGPRSHDNNTLNLGKASQNQHGQLLGTLVVHVGGRYLPVYVGYN